MHTKKTTSKRANSEGTVYKNKKRTLDRAGDHWL